MHQACDGKAQETGQNISRIMSKANINYQAWRFTLYSSQERLGLCNFSAGFAERRRTSLAEGDSGACEHRDRQGSLPFFLPIPYADGKGENSKGDNI